jgi:hypothetical protein
VDTENYAFCLRVKFVYCAVGGRRHRSNWVKIQGGPPTLSPKKSGPPPTLSSSLT